MSGVAGLFDQEGVAELGVVGVGVEQRVGPMCGNVFGVGDWIGQPAVVGLAGELEYPARHRNGNPVGGELSRAGKAFSRQIGLRQIRRGPAQHFVLLLEQLDPSAGFPQL